MRVLFLTGRETNYPRNSMILKAFQQFSDVNVVYPRDLRSSITQRSLSILLDYYTRKDLASYDLIFIGFYGHIILLNLPPKKSPPILFDAFVSTYDTLIVDRKIANPGSFLARLSLWLDRTACRKASHILLDTQANINYFFNLIDRRENKYSRFFVGCDDQLFHPRIHNSSLEKTILFYGSFLPLHGVDVILKAAALLQNCSDIRFRIIGHGKEYIKARLLARSLELSNVDFLPPVPLDALPNEIASSMICLGGHFGESEKASRVIAGKTFQCLAMAKPTIVGDNQANRELMTHGHDAWFCNMNDPESLASSIEMLVNNLELRSSLGKNGYNTFLERASLQVISAQLQNLVEQLLKPISPE